MNHLFYVLLLIAIYYSVNAQDHTYCKSKVENGKNGCIDIKDGETVSCIGDGLAKYRYSNGLLQWYQNSRFAKAWTKTSNTKLIHCDNLSIGTPITRKDCPIGYLPTFYKNKFDCVKIRINGVIKCFDYTNRLYKISGTELFPISKFDYFADIQNAYCENLDKLRKCSTGKYYDIFRGCITVPDFSIVKCAYTSGSYIFKNDTIHFIASSKNLFNINRSLKTEYNIICDKIPKGMEIKKDNWNSEKCPKNTFKNTKYGCMRLFDGDVIKCEGDESLTYLFKNGRRRLHSLKFTFKNSNTVDCNDIPEESDISENECPDSKYLNSENKCISLPSISIVRCIKNQNLYQLNNGKLRKFKNDTNIDKIKFFWGRTHDINCAQIPFGKPIKDSICPETKFLTKNGKCVSLKEDDVFRCIGDLSLHSFKNGFRRKYDSETIYESLGYKSTSGPDLYCENIPKGANISNKECPNGYIPVLVSNEKFKCVKIRSSPSVRCLNQNDSQIYLLKDGARRPYHTLKIADRWGYQSNFIDNAICDEFPIGTPIGSTECPGGKLMNMNGKCISFFWKSRIIKCNGKNDIYMYFPDERAIYRYSSFILFFRPVEYFCENIIESSRIIIDEYYYY